jgi:hypothetical protein
MINSVALGIKYDISLHVLIHSSSYNLIGGGWTMLGVGFWVLGTGCVVPGSGCWMLGVGYLVLGCGCRVLGVGRWIKIMLSPASSGQGAGVFR